MLFYLHILYEHSFDRCVAFFDNGLGTIFRHNIKIMLLPKVRYGNHIQG
jgi:hypothetical protein